MLTFPLGTDRLVQPWIYKDPPPPILNDPSQSTQSPLETVAPEVGPEVQSSNSSVSLGDTHVWRDVGYNA